MGLPVSEAAAVYEVKLVAYNGNGESDCSKRLVSLAEEGMSDQTTGKNDHRLCPGTAFSRSYDYTCECCGRKSKKESTGKVKF